MQTQQRLNREETEKHPISLVFPGWLAGLTVKLFMLCYFCHNGAGGWDETQTHSMSLAFMSVGSFVAAAMVNLVTDLLKLAELIVWFPISQTPKIPSPKSWMKVYFLDFNACNKDVATAQVKSYFQPMQRHFGTSKVQDGQKLLFGLMVNTCCVLFEAWYFI